MENLLLPFIVIPNNKNNSDSEVFIENSVIKTVSELRNESTFLKQIIKDGIKLMCDSSQTTEYNPTQTEVYVERIKCVSVTFFCSKDNFGRQTSMAVVFNFEEKEKAINLVKKFVAIYPNMINENKVISILENASFNNLNLLKSKKKIIIYSLILLSAVTMFIFRKMQEEKKRNPININRIIK